MNTTLTKIAQIAKIVVTAILIIGLFGVFNESHTFMPNFVGLGCFAGLIYLYRNHGD